MGGYSSGRVGWRAKCENCLSIDVRRAGRARDSYPDIISVGSGTFNGDQTCSIGVWGYSERIELEYTKDGEKYRYPVYLTFTPCHFGGKRQWFLCPAVGCNHSAAKLYLGSRYFACRRCYNLAYQSQCYSPHDRALTQARKIRLRLDGYEGIANPFPDKPKRMRWRTYERLRERCERYEEISDSRLWRLMARWMGNGDLSKLLD